MRLLLLEDSDEDAELFSYSVKDQGLNWKVDHVKTLGAFREQAPKDEYDGFVIDLRLVGEDGIDAIEWLHKEKVPGEIVVFSTSENEIDHARARRAGAGAFLTKPLDIRGMRLAMKQMVEFLCR